MLKHPFYQAWSDGALSLDTLRFYTQQYWHHVAAFPQYVSAAHSRCPDMDGRQQLLRNLIEEESGADNHPELWTRFGESLGLAREDIASAKPLAETQALVDTYRELSSGEFVEAAVALYCYESQVPAVAATKIDGLKRFYGIEGEGGLSFFSVHLQADEYHADADRALIERYATDEASAARALAAAERATDALWGFLDGVGRECGVC